MKNVFVPSWQVARERLQDTFLATESSPRVGHAAAIISSFWKNDVFRQDLGCLSALSRSSREMLVSRIDQDGSILRHARRI
jgi:hypothetical protein